MWVTLARYLITVITGKNSFYIKTKNICFYVKSNSFLRENKKTVEFVYLGNLFW